MKAAASALGIDPEDLTLLISQMVTLKRGDETVRASKRTGDFVTLRELVDEVGADACRYFFLARAASTQMEFDLELATRESSENPVYYVQYAHARNASILNLAAERGIDYDAGDVTLLTHPYELGLIRTMLRLPELIVQVAENLEPHHLPHYAMELATAFHHFYENCRVISANPEDNELTLARLKLVAAAQIVFRPHLDVDGDVRPGTDGTVKRTLAALFCDPITSRFWVRFASGQGSGVERENVQLGDATGLPEHGFGCILRVLCYPIS